jgi:hypothetical protein
MERQMKLPQLLCFYWAKRVAMLLAHPGQSTVDAMLVRVRQPAYITFVTCRCPIILYIILLYETEAQERLFCALTRYNVTFWNGVYMSQGF